MIIELYGLPSVGKSTLANYLKKEGFRVIKKPNLFSRLVYFLLFFCIKPRFCLYLLKHITINALRSKDVSKIRLFTFWFFVIYLTLISKYFLAILYRNKMIILDEGLCQFFLGTSLDNRQIDFDFLIKHSGNIFVIEKDEKTRKKDLKYRHHSQSKYIRFGEKYYLKFEEKIKPLDRFIRLELRKNENFAGKVSFFKNNDYNSILCDLKMISRGVTKLFPCV
jgi:hypothetical protein